MPSGRVKMFDEDKGFGFIQPDDGGDDVFVHRKVFGGDRTAFLNKGDKVSYETEWDTKKNKYCVSECTGFKTGGGGGGGGNDYDSGGGRGGGGRGGGGGSAHGRKGVCHAFQDGRCKRGDDCRYSHELDGGRSRSPDRGGPGGPGGYGGMAPPGYGMPPPGYGMPPPGYGGPPPGYGMPPPGYGGPPPGYGGPPPGYGGPPPGYGGPPPGYGGPPAGYGGPPQGCGGPSPYGAPGGPPQGGAPPGLPPGWEQLNDPASGRPYFCNRSTGETSWTPPTAPSPAPTPAPAPGGPAQGGAPPGLPPGWEQINDPASGRPYFCNRSTGETSWTPPAAPAGSPAMQPAAAPAPTSAPQGLPEGWEQLTDPASGKPYFVNRASGTTQWTPP